MAFKSVDIDGFNSVEADATGNLVVKRTGGPSGAYGVFDDNGQVSLAVVGPEGQGAGQVYAQSDLTLLQTLVTIWNNG